MQIVNHSGRLSLMIIFILVASTSRSQFSVGVEGGYNKNYLITNNSNRAFTNYLPRNGFSVGIPVTYRVNDWLAIAAVPSYITKNYRQERSGFFKGIYQNNTNVYLQLPLTARASFGGTRLRGFIDAGVFGGYWQSSRIKGVNANILDVPSDIKFVTNVFEFQSPFKYDQPYAFDKVKDNRYEGGITGGLGLAYDITPKFQVYAEGKIFYSLTDQQKNYMTNQVPRYNTTYGMHLGVMYHLHPKTSLQ